MKRVIAIAVVLVLVLSSTTAFAGKACSTSKGGSGKKGFFNELSDLFKRRIPDTRNQKSATHNLWSQTGERVKKPADSSVK